MSRAPITLTREMRMVLTALGLVALLGGWLVYNNAHKVDDTAVVTPPTTQTTQTPATDGTTPAGTKADGSKTDETKTDGTTTGTAGTGNTTTTTDPSQGLTVVTSDGKTEVATLPPFPVTGAGTTAPVAAAVPVPTPSGINPNEKLSSLGGYNPFRASGSAAGAGNPVTATLPTTAPVAPVSITQPASTTQQINDALAASSGVMPIPSIAGANNSSGNIPHTSGSTGAIPQPTIPGTGATGGTLGRVTISTPPASSTVGSSGNAASSSNTSSSTTGTIPVPSVAQPAKTGTGAGNTGSAARPTTATTQPPATRVPAIRQPAGSVIQTPTASATVAPPVIPAPPKPSMKDVTEPGLNIPGGVTGNAAGSTGTAGNSTVAGTAATNGGLLAGTPTTPQVIAEVQPGAADAATSGATAPNTAGTDTAGTAPTAPVTAVDTAVQEHQLIFDAAVLGPVNTAVFRSDKGYVVATVGQTIPSTNIVLKEVTATTATLAVGNTTKTLQLDKK